MANQILVIAPYWLDSVETWVFDDEAADLVQEPFVEGIPEMIDDLVADIPNARQGFRLLFSVAPFPGYQRKLLMVEPSPSDQFQQMRVALDQAPGERLYEPSNPMADADGYVTKSNVSLVMEMADMREANRTYEANLNSFQQARTMYRSLLDILRR